MTGEVNEKPLHFKMNGLMAPLRGSKIESCKARAESSSDVQDVVLDAPKEMKFLLEIG